MCLCKEKGSFDVVHDWAVYDGTERVMAELSFLAKSLSWRMAMPVASRQQHCYILKKGTECV